MNSDAAPHRGLDVESRQGRGAGGTTEQPDLSTVVLGYRAGEGLAAVVERLTNELEALGREFEIVLVANYDSGSVDTTPEVARRLAEADARVQVVARAKEGGMGWDLRAGLEATTGRVLVVMDGDGQNPPEDVARAYHALVEGAADVVKGRRVTRHDGLYRRLLSGAYNVIFTLFFGTWGLWDINGKPKGMTREAYERLSLHSDDWFLDAELVLAARRQGMRIVEIPVQFRASTSRQSFVRPEAILEFARHMLSYRLRGRP
jgi:glycosyltransferase involved in cell wall biosynthesis